MPIGPLSPDPITGVIPWVRQKISGAQNLSGNLNSRRATGPWGCKNCRWCGSTSAPGYPSQRHRSESWREPQGAPLHKSHTDAVGEGLKVNCPEGAREATLGCAPPAVFSLPVGPVWDRPLRRSLEKNAVVSVGAGHRPARRCLEPNLSPASHKGALSTDRRNTQRFPETQRQRS